ncbi:unnamed protein product [Schistocephalus solidus]|uniref:Endo/exonuclease/phosphatase domain-containing protein n=1 Tax=Schistocephalus solidus TaxID=70667 RepID=A0A183T3Y1_SCHSO|nr:unnamed protein product [Schistocephalus solidus]
MALVARELARYKVDIAALSETRFSEQSQLEELGAGYTFWSGRPNSERRDAGVAFAIRNGIVGSLPCLPQGINDCLMSLRLPLRVDSLVSRQSQEDRRREKTQVAGMAGSLRRATTPPCSAFVMGTQPE